MCGVVQDVSNATPDTAGDLWIPLFLHSWVSRTSEGEKLIGNVHIYMLAPTPADKEALRAEVQDVFRKYNNPMISGKVHSERIPVRRLIGVNC